MLAIVLSVLVVVLLIVAAGAWMTRSMQATDGQVAAFGAVVEASLGAVRDPAERAAWRIDDRERGFRATLRAGSRSSSVEFLPMGMTLSQVSADAAHAAWCATDPGGGAGLTVEFEDAEDPHSTWLVERLADAVQQLAASPVGLVVVMLPALDVTVEAPGGADAARALSRVYPALRDLYAEVARASEDPRARRAASATAS